MFLFLFKVFSDGDEKNLFDNHPSSAGRRRFIDTKTDFYSGNVIQHPSPFFYL